MRPKTIHPNDCGNCIHWHEWSDERHYTRWEGQWKPGDLAFGDCDKIPAGTIIYESGICEFIGEPYGFDGYVFEDECYDEDMHCFEGREDVESGKHDPDCGVCRQDRKGDDHGSGQM